MIELRLYQVQAEFALSELGDSPGPQSAVLSLLWEDSQEADRAVCVAESEVCDVPMLEV